MKQMQVSLNTKRLCHAIVLWFFCLPAAVAQHRVVFSNFFSTNEAPVYSSRIFLVFGPQEETAKAILKDRKFVRLDTKNVNEILGKSGIDPAKMLDEQAQAADAYAAWRERDASLPFFSKSRQWMLQEAAAHRKFADYTRSINPDTLTPYLVKVHVALRGTGAFNLRWRNDKLLVFYGSLGTSEGEKRDVYFVVFLEHSLTGIEMSTSVVE